MSETLAKLSKMSSKHVMKSTTFFRLFHATFTLSRICYLCNFFSRPPILTPARSSPSSSVLSASVEGLSDVEKRAGHPSKFSPEIKVCYSLLESADIFMNSYIFGVQFSLLNTFRLFIYRKKAKAIGGSKTRSRLYYICVSSWRFTMR